ncbi:Uu.00g026510.m01.CDS01 [Anthostomella pinea]|uniref:Uu.00g026510.m01.CDS01 n=1 Tax=Anthostomella pinea TaxID=933095 RepID=A0AAI8V7L3_9PEZI|nr:Uu.00g026510.m01.CDS01 [Anthostomella pinea]
MTASRKTPSRKQAALQRQHRESDLQSRVETLEGQLSTVLEKVERLERSGGQAGQPLISTPSKAVAEACSEDSGVVDQVRDLPTTEFPPLQEVMLIIEHYLATFNTVFPLFHPSTLLQTVKSWYQSPHSRSPVTWALINVVLALAHHTSNPGGRIPAGNTATYLHNAQSVLTEVTMRDIDLVNVQVLLGLVMLFWTADDMGPALMLISTALRLAHQCRLHTRRGSEHLSPSLTRQRDRVFWMAYILDRDISLDCRLPPVQVDSDTDLDLPPSEADGDLAGFIFTPDVGIKMNYFRARVELAQIQGKVYDCIYSVSAQNSNLEERAQNVARITHMLDHWSSRILPEFRVTTLTQSGFPELSRYFCTLYSIRLSCRAQISFASASDSFHYSGWIERLKVFGGEVAAGQVVSTAPVPQGWQELTQAAREYMLLFQTVTPLNTFFIRMNLCAYNSSLIALIANRIFDAHHTPVEADRQITKAAMENLEDIAKLTGSDKLRKYREAARQLCLYADLIPARPPTFERMTSGLGFWVAEPRDRFEDQFLDDTQMPGANLYWSPASD